MIKMKTHSGAKKRFNLTKSGKIKRKKAFARHILTKKPQNRMRKLRNSFSSPCFFKCWNFTYFYLKC